MSTTMKDRVREVISCRVEDMTEEIMDIVQERDKRIADLEFDLATKRNDFIIWYDAAFRKDERIAELERQLADLTALREREGR